MAIVGKAVSVGTSATLITEGQGGQGAGVVAASGASVKNNGGADVFLGGSGVTTAAGFPLAAGETIDVGQLGSDDSLYGIVAAGTVEVRVLEFD